MNAADQFETIVSDHDEPLYKFAMSLTRAESDARDLTQQTFYIWAKKGHRHGQIANRPRHPAAQGNSVIGRQPFGTW